MLGKVILIATALVMSQGFRLSIIGHHPITLEIAREAASRGWRVMISDYDKFGYWRDQLSQDDKQNGIAVWTGDRCDSVIVLKSKMLPRDPHDIYELMGSPSPVVLLKLDDSCPVEPWLKGGKQRLVHILYIRDIEFITIDYIKMLLDLCNIVQ